MTQLRILLTSLLISLLAWQAAASDTSSASSSKTPALCASSEQAAAVRALYATPPAPPTFMAAGKLGLAEAVVASALGATQAIGTSGAGFEAVWNSLRGWPGATAVIVKGGQVLEVHGPVPTGAPSTKSKFYNLTADGAGLGGHLRPDLIGAIYAVNLEGAQGPLRGVTFVDLAGDSIFGMYLPEAGSPSKEQLARFDQTWNVIKALPRACE